MKKYTIRDIAKMAGVSPGTVSKVINNTGSISQKTIERVGKIIKETGYQPSFSAKSLATQKSNLIGLIYAGEITAEFNHPFFNQVVNSFKNEIGKLGYDILLFSNQHFSQTKENFLARCKHFHIDGCLIIAGDKIEEATYELDKSDVPCVGIDLVLEGKTSSYVMTDNRKVSAYVVEHLNQNSIKNVAFIGGPIDSTISSMRKDAFLHYTELHNMTVRPEWILHGDYFDNSGYELMNKIIANKPYPEAVFAASDLMALGALKALKEAGISVPEDIKVIGCDDIEACRYSDPPLATVRQDKEKMGEVAAHMLHELINVNKTISPVLVEPELIIRDSYEVNLKKDARKREVYE